MNAHFKQLVQNIAWTNLSHFNGSAADIPALLQATNSPDQNNSRIAIAQIANLIEKDHQLVIITPIILTHFANNIHAEQANRDLILTLFLRIGKAVAYKWEEYRNCESLISDKDIATICQSNSPFYIADTTAIDNDQQIDVLDYTADMHLQTWQYTVCALLESKTILETLTNATEYENGLVYEILTILKMIKPQEQRKVFAPSFTHQTSLVRMRPIHPEDSNNLTQHLQGKTAQYLSFDPNGNQRIIDYYIDQSIVEQAMGNALVLQIEDSATGEFLGSCALNDINDESVELGIWLKETAQGKGLGKHIVQEMLYIIEKHIPTTYVLYNVEKDNEHSIAIPNALGFKATSYFMLAPTPLKNAVRHMVEYRKYNKQ